MNAPLAHSPPRWLGQLQPLLPRGDAAATRANQQSIQDGASLPQQARLDHVRGAFAMATALFWLTMLTAPPTSRLRCPALRQMCLASRWGSGLVCGSRPKSEEAWVRAQRLRQLQLDAVLVRTAQGSVRIGQDDKAVESLRALEGMSAAWTTHPQPVIDQPGRERFSPEGRH